VPKTHTSTARVSVVDRDYVTNSLQALVASVGHRNTSVKRIRRRLPVQRLSRSCLGVVLSQQPIRVLVAASLPRALWVAEIYLHVGGNSELSVVGELGSSVPGQRSPQGYRAIAVPPASQCRFPWSLLLGPLPSALGSPDPRSPPASAELKLHPLSRLGQCLKQWRGASDGYVASNEDAHSAPSSVCRGPARKDFDRSSRVTPTTPDSLGTRL
jgi:hypothetical protein